MPIFGPARRFSFVSTQQASYFPTPGLSCPYPTLPIPGPMNNPFVECRPAIENPGEFLPSNIPGALYEPGPSSERYVSGSSSSSCGRVDAFLLPLWIGESDLQESGTPGSDNVLSTARVSLEPRLAVAAFISSGLIIVGMQLLYDERNASLYDIMLQYYYALSNLGRIVPPAGMTQSARSVIKFINKRLQMSTSRPRDTRRSTRSSRSLKPSTSRGPYAVLPQPVVRLPPSLRSRHRPRASGRSYTPPRPPVVSRR